MKEHLDNLERLLRAGKVWIERGEVVGRASDGVIVNLGLATQLDDVESYLQDHPTPEDW